MAGGVTYIMQPPNTTPMAVAEAAAEFVQKKGGAQDIVTALTSLGEEFGDQPIPNHDTRFICRLLEMVFNGTP